MNDQKGEEELLRELRRLASGPPRGAAERRIVDALRARGLLTGAAPPRRLLAAAVVAVVFATGMLAGLGWRAGRASVEREPTYALFLLGGVAGGPDEAARVEEYREWAVAHARAGRLASGERLASPAWLLVGDDGGAGAITGERAFGAMPLAGFFLLTTDDLAEALAIARSCPHLRHGGEVALRPIAPT